MSPARSAIRKAVGVTLGVLAFIILGGLLTRVLLPHASGEIRALVVTFALTVVVVALVPRFGGWRELGVRAPVSWRHPLLVVLLLLALTPWARGFGSVTAGELAVLVVGYALTGFTEELVWRGAVQGILEPFGPLRGVLLTSALFGVSHLGNVLYRDSVGLVLAQAWGAFCFGVGYGAVRRRVGSVVPLMVLHALTDLAAATGALPAIPVLVAQDVVLLSLGLVLLTRHDQFVASTPDAVLGRP